MENKIGPRSLATRFRGRKKDSTGRLLCCVVETPGSFLRDECLSAARIPFSPWTVYFFRTWWRLAPPSLASLGKIGLGDRITPTPISEPPAQPSSAQSAPIPPWWPSRSSPAPPTTVLCGPRQGWALLPWLALALFFPLRAGSPSPPQGRRLRSARGPPGSWAGQKTPRPWAGQRTPEAGRG